MSKNRKKYFQQKLLNWHQYDNSRELPWKEEPDVYKIWLSEIILQQTRAEQGRKYYDRFVKAYPTIRHLAKAPLEEVYKLWEGLGYYNRCRNLHASARQIVTEFNGRFPDTYDSILALKGVGPYTAAAIASFAFHLPYAVVDGNVFRVLSRFFGIETPIDAAKGKRLFSQLAQECLATGQPARYNQAIMDFGATVCKPDVPLCKTCPLRRNCIAFVHQKTALLPVKEKQVKQRSRWFIYFIMEQNKRFAVHKRTGADIWSQLYEFPLYECATKEEWEIFRKKKGKQTFPLIKSPVLPIAVTRPVKQKLSHQTIHAIAVLLQLPPRQNTYTSTGGWKTQAQLKQLPFPRLIHQLLEANIMDIFDHLP